MSVLVGNEMAHGYAGLAAQIRLAGILEKAGKDTVLAMPRLDLLRELRTECPDADILQAPYHIARIAGMPKSSSELNALYPLNKAGYGDIQSLGLLIRCWISILEMEKPEIVFGVACPSLMIAAYVMDIPRVYIGDQISQIFRGDRLLSWREGADVAPWNLIANINACLSDYRACPIDSLGQLVPDSPLGLTSTKLFDPFAGRAEASCKVQYLGLPMLSPWRMMHLKPSRKPRVFSYLIDQKCLPQLSLFSELGYEVHVYLRQQRSVSILDKYPQMIFYGKPVSFYSLGRDDLVVTNGLGTAEMAVEMGLRTLHLADGPIIAAHGEFCSAQDLSRMLVVGEKLDTAGLSSLIEDLPCPNQRERVDHWEAFTAFAISNLVG